MTSAAPGDWVKKTELLSEMDLSQLNYKVSTDRYSSEEFQARERELVWMKTWQVVGRVDELEKAGDWKVYDLFDQSFVIAKGSDGEIRGFVNACRHRGNVLCDKKKGNNARFTCPYHLWSFALDGRLVGVARPDLVGEINKDELGLIEVPVDTFAGFIFLNPDLEAQPLRDYLGQEVVEGLAPYKLDEMIPVGMDVREGLNCNWKVVLDAFSEGYHIIGVHPELLSVIDLQAGTSRHGHYGDHGLAVSPFEVKRIDETDLEAQVQGIRDLPGTFPTVAEVLPLFEQLVDGYRDSQGELCFPDGVTVRTILQQATRQTLTAKGLDVSGLSDDQMSDNQAWFLFPNFFMTIRAGEATTILVYPDPGSDPTKCVWHCTAYMWLPEAYRKEHRTELVEVTEPNTYPYFLALQQDYDQMQRQQAGLNNKQLKYLQLVREETNVARFHSTLDRYLEGASAS